MTGGQVRGLLLVGIFGFLLAGHRPAVAQSLINPPGSSIVLPNSIASDVKLPTIVVPKDGPPVVILPPSTLPGVAVLNTAGLPQDLNLPKGEKLLLVNLAGSSILVPNLAELATFGNGVLGIVLDQVAPVSQLFATTTTGNLLTTIDQLIDNVVAGNPASFGGAPAVPSPSTSVVTYAASNVWTWNAATLAATEHAGFRFQANGGGRPVTGATLPVRSVDRAEMPGILWDASSEMGLPRGTVYFGATGGVARSDIDLKSNDALEKVAAAEAGSVELTSWMAGGFGLIVTDSWYAGTTAGGSWGESESKNFLTGAAADYDLTDFTSSLFLGRILPVTDTIRVDFRGTLAYQRTVADAHTDTLGITYGEHTIEAASAAMSARLFALLREGDDVTFRPYIQAGVAERFHYDNGLDVSGINFVFNDANSGVFTAGGIDVEIGETLHLSAGLRHDHSSDFDRLSGRLGLLVRLN